MSIHDLYNETITNKIETCNSFVRLRKKIEAFTKFFSGKEIVNIECKLIVTFREEN